MANRRFEMYEYRQVLNRMRLGETDRAVARSGLMGREKAGAFRKLACDHGWLDPTGPLPDDATLARALQPSSSTRTQTESLVLPHQSEVTAWWRRGIRGRTIHQALVRNYGSGSYSSIRRFLQQLNASHPDASTVLDFDPGEVAQVDFGKGPTITDVHTGELVLPISTTAMEGDDGMIAILQSLLQLIFKLGTPDVIFQEGGVDSRTHCSARRACLNLQSYWGARAQDVGRTRSHLSFSRDRHCSRERRPYPWWNNHHLEKEIRCIHGWHEAGFHRKWAGHELAAERTHPPRLW